GFVKVTQSLPGGEIVLKYLARGDYLGEIGLLRGGARTATCTALDHVELVQIRADDFHEMMRRFPAIQARLMDVARARIGENQERHERVASIRRRDSLEILIEDWCIGCGLCAKNCPYGNINIHNFTVMVADETRPGRRRAVVREKATTCDLCHDLKEPSCVYACPHGAA